mmetsp:Transcript_10152/g.7731  ORF Transcript_10152/g.7731 Transcript_10152/m.7731 type:complete len:118 (-) Transcript_10152:39-392(-)
MKVFFFFFFFFFLVVIHEAESRAPASAKRCLESKELDGLVVVFVHLCKLFCQILLGNIGGARMHHLNDKLLAAKQRVVLELPRANQEIRHGARISKGACDTTLYCPLEPKWLRTPAT